MWKAIKYEDKYIEGMIDMTRDYYGETEISNYDYIWHEYFKNPAGDAIIQIAYDDQKNKIVGQFIVAPKKYLINKHLYLGGHSLNTLIDENYQGQGIFSGLGKSILPLLKDRLSFCYGTPNQNSYRGFIKNLQFLQIGEIPLFIKVLRPSEIVLTKFNNNLLKYIFKPLDIIFNRSVNKMANKSDISAIEITEKNKLSVDQLWEQIKYKYNVCMIRDSDFIDWRYLSIPIREYKIFMAFNHDKPCAMIVGRVSELNGMKCGMIVDFIQAPGRFDEGMFILEKLIGYFKGQHIDILGCLMQNNTEEAKLLKKKGFFICPGFLLPQPFPILLKLFDQKTDPCIYNFSNWFFTMGDYDVV